jgi:tetratricopeptide (TPR) repeat protein
MEHEAVEGHRDNATAFFVLAEELLNKRFRLKQATKAVNRGLALAPEAVVGHDLLGRIALRRNRWKEAELAYRRALALDPENWVLMNNLGIALRGQRRQRESIEAFEQAARLNPRSEVARGNLHIETIRSLGAGVPLLLFALAEARLATLVPSDHSGWILPMAVLVPVMAVPLAVMYLRSRRRLSPTARAFHASQSRRSRKIYVPLLTITLVGAAAIVYLGGRLFLAQPTIRSVVGVAAALMLWLVGFPLVATALVRREIPSLLAWSRARLRRSTAASGSRGA